MLEARSATASNRLRRRAPKEWTAQRHWQLAAHKRIADLEREVLEIRLSYSHNGVTQKEPEAN